MGCIRDGVPWERPSNSSIQLSRVAMGVHTQHPDSPILRPLAPPPPMPCSPGKVYLSSSSDKGVTWSRPASNALPNPNSQFSTVTIDGQVWEARQPGRADVFFGRCMGAERMWQRRPEAAPRAAACSTPPLHSLALPPPSQVLCVFNNSTTSRAPLALALSVNDCKSWEPLAIIEEEPKGGWRHKGNGGASCEVRAQLQSSSPVSAPTHWHAPFKP